MILGNRQKTYINEEKAAAHLVANVAKYDGLTQAQVLHAHNDPAFLKSLEQSGYGAVHLADNDAHKERLYVSMCHRHYTATGMREVISSAERHVKWIQSQENRRLQEHGEFMKSEGKQLGQMEGYVAGHARGLEVKKAPLFGGKIFGDFAGGFVDTFRWVGVVGVALILAIIYMMYGKGKG
jgi:hypothetical protein